jgi:hypothetical protein
MKKSARYALGLLVLAPLAGCSGTARGLPALHPLTGKVVKDGQAVPGGTVNFYPEPEQPAYFVYADVGPDGRFAAQTVSVEDPKKTRHPGVPANTYKVTYYPRKVEGTPTAEPVVAPAPVTVKTGENDVTIDLGATK